jgi:hypothetical protein
MNLINQSELLGIGNSSPQSPAKKEIRAGMRAKTGAIST